MSKLVIEYVDFADQATGAQPLDMITVTLLRTNTLDIFIEPSLPPSPGVYLVIPVHGSAQLTTQSQAFQLPSSIALLVSGKQNIQVRTDDQNAVSDHSPVLKVIEINARIGDATPLHEMLHLPLMLDSALSDLADALFEKLSFGEDSIQLSPDSVDISRHLLSAQLVTLILKADPSKLTTNRSRNQRLEKLKSFLFQNMTRQVTNPEMAHHLGMSRTSFCRWAQETLGCSPARYFRQLRLERCQEWIAQNAGNLDEIANQTGFSHRYHLSREFKKHFGITPAQYRKKAQNIPQAMFLEKEAEQNYRHGRINEALAACDQCLKANPPAPIRDRARYQKGLCLRALGRGTEAITEWSALEVSPLSHRAAVQECRQLFNIDDSTPALQLLEKIFANASDTQKRDGVSLWIDHVLALRDAHRTKQLRVYLDVRKRLFPQDIRSMQLTLTTLRDLGENLEIPEQCNHLKASCFFALRRAGKLEAALEQFAQQLDPEHVAASLLLYGRHEEILAMKTAPKRFKAIALTRLGRAKEAIKRYPDDSACAYLALGLFEELLEKFPEHDYNNILRTSALIALSRTSEIDKLLESSLTEWQWLPAQLYINPKTIIESSHPEAAAYTNRARLLMTLQSLLAKNETAAKDWLNQIDGVQDLDFWWVNHTSAEVLITSIVRSLVGNAAGLENDLDEIVINFKYKDKQVLWHDASYLKNNVSLADYRHQPQQAWIHDRSTFIQAVREDLMGQRAKAKSRYKQIENTLHYDDNASLLRQQFSQWRLQCL